MPNNLYDELKALIYDTQNREYECRGYLTYAADVLFRDGGTDIVCDVEYRGHSGDSDFIVIGRAHGSGSDCIRAYLWELKAPQCFLFVRDRSSANRLFPSKDLLQAENQLLNYYDELRDSVEFRSEFGITHPSNVLMGGIIIGCNKTKVNGEMELARRNRLYEKAFRCRSLFYRSDIQLKIWNTILDQLLPPKLEERV